MKSVRSGTLTAPIALGIVTILSYGLLLPVTGFYWDDWPFAWIARFLGPAAFIPAFSGFRPFLGPVFFLTTSVFPPNPLIWQILAVVVRLLAALSAWYALRQVWPEHRLETLVASLLFLVFPGYSQHWVSFTHINQEWISFICYLLSLGISAHAVRNPKYRLRDTLAGLALLCLGLLPTEYFIGLEPMRFLFIWFITAESVGGFRARLSAAWKAWWPYVLIWGMNLAWLLYFYRSGFYISYDLTAAHSVPALNQVATVFMDALWKAGIYAWFQAAVLLAGSMATPSSMAAVVLIIVSFVLSALYLQGLHFPEGADGSSNEGLSKSSGEGRLQSSHSRFAIAASCVGLAGVLLGRLPSFGAGLPLTLQSSFDRFMISMMLGASLFITGLVSLLVRNPRLRNYVFSALLALGIGQQFLDANIFRRDWQRQQEIYWQFAWRMPGLEPGTAIITQQMPLDYETDLSMTAALNWIYAPQSRPRALTYAVIYSEKRLGGAALPDLRPGTIMQLPFRTVNFTGSTSRALVVYVPPNGCLRVLDPARRDAETYARYPESVTGPIALSNPGLILTTLPPPSLPNPPFVDELPHTWCYYYEKAELAAQVEDWGNVAQLGNETIQADLAPQDMLEWLPFIEGYARSGNLTLAEHLTRQVWNQDPKVHKGVCALWRRVASDQSGAGSTLGTRLTEELGCAQ